MDIKIDDTPVVESDKVEIVVIADRSGSMQSIKVDAIGAFNSFIEEQQKNSIGEANLTVVLFDDKYEIMQEGVVLNEAVAFDDKNFVPRGMTALLDAIGKTVNTLVARKAKGEVDGAIIAILTDGAENASREYNQTQVKELIENAEKEHGWTFVYLAANQDAIQVAGAYGISAKNAVNFAATGEGIAGATMALGDYTTTYRSARSTAANSK